MLLGKRSKVAGGKVASNIERAASKLNPSEYMPMGHNIYFDGSALF